MCALMEARDILQMSLRASAMARQTLLIPAPAQISTAPSKMCVCYGRTGPIPPAISFLAGDGSLPVAIRSSSVALSERVCPTGLAGTAPQHTATRASAGVLPVTPIVLGLLLRHRALPRSTRAFWARTMPLAIVPRPRRSFMEGGR